MTDLRFKIIFALAAILVSSLAVVILARADGGAPRAAPGPLPLLVHNGSLMTQVFDPSSGHLLIQSPPFEPFGHRR
jgi:hypothetical protein